MHPAEIWEQSGRDKTVDILFRFTSDNDQDIVLAPTHEENITTLMSEAAELPRAPSDGVSNPNQVS